MFDVEDFTDLALDTLASVLEKKVLDLLISGLGIAVGGFWFKVVSFAVKLLFKHVVKPAAEDLMAEGYLFLRKQALAKKVEEFKNAQTPDEADEAFANMLGAPRN